MTTPERVDTLVRDVVTLEVLFNKAIHSRPNSKWRVESLANISAFISHTGMFIDWPVLPGDDPPPPPPPPPPKKSRKRKLPADAKFGRNPFIDDQAGCDDDDDDEQEATPSTQNNEQEAAPSTQNSEGKLELKQALRRTFSYGEDLCFFYAIAWRQWLIELEKASITKSVEELAPGELPRPPPPGYNDMRNKFRKKDPRCFVDESRDLLKRFQREHPELGANFSGVTFEMIPHIEKLFNMRIEVCIIIENV